MAERYEQNAVLRIQPAGDAGDVGIRDGQLGRGLGAAAAAFQNYYTDTHLKGQAIRQLHRNLTQHPMALLRRGIFVASNKMRRYDFHPSRLKCAALFTQRSISAYFVATCLEAATFRRVNGAGDIALQNNAIRMH